MRVRTLDPAALEEISFESAVVMLTAFMSPLKPSTPFESALPVALEPPIALVADDVTLAALDPYRAPIMSEEERRMG
jgi:hypothetical protein